MPEAARRVLADCEVALDMLEDERDEQRWRVLWIGAMAILRAVGHVLLKVDGDIPRQRELINAAYRRWKDDGRSEHSVFRRFIEEERNNILKEYRLNVVDSGEVGVVVVAGDPEAGCVTDETPSLLDENLFRPVTGSFGAGEDARDVYREAVKWWDTELSRLESVVAELEDQDDEAPPRN